MSIYRGMALSIAGTDPGGGAGMQADLKTFSALKVFGMSVITAVNAQNSLGVSAIYDMPPEIITAQMESVFSDFGVMATKTGMLSRKETIRAVCDGIRKYNVKMLVVDPVMVAQSGDSLISDGAVEAMKELLLPLTFLLTPNVPEAEKLSGIRISGVDDMKEAARIISELGPHAVLVKGGHLPGSTITDVLFLNGEYSVFRDSCIETGNTHGTGCTLSSAITAELSAGEPLEEAVRRGRLYLRLALENSFKPGHGYGPVGHAVKPDWIA